LKKSNISYFIIFLFFFTESSGQRFGIQGGINLSKILLKDNYNNYSDKLESNPGINGGVTLGFRLSHFIEVEAAALYESRGYKYEDEVFTQKLNLLYADIPVLLKVGPTYGPFKIFGAAGPYLGIGIMGNYKYFYGPDKITHHLKWGNGDEDYLKRMDFGVKFGVGAEAMNITLGAYYTVGLVNIIKTNDYGTKFLNRGISICVGYKY
jgi:hypothetical protein